MLSQSEIEKIPTHVFQTSEQGSVYVANEIAALIKSRQAEGKQCVLGLATGSTPTRMYAELISLHKKGLSFKNVHTFNLDEYYPMPPNSLQSYVRFMNEHLFDELDIPKENIHIPDGTLAKDKVAEFCKSYDAKIAAMGGIDLQVLGVGRTGHIGFNEPGSSERSATRLITLDQVTRIDAASDFFGEENVPTKAITMGVGTIMRSKRVIMMAWGEGKGAVVKKAVEGPVTDQIPSTFLQKHPNTLVILDEAAASQLTAVNTPWLVDSCEWDEKLIRKAVVWLCQQLKKPILKLTNHDYMEHGMGDIITEFGLSGEYKNFQSSSAYDHGMAGWQAQCRRCEQTRTRKAFSKESYHFQSAP
jgi:glucosamine-6-phosphate deaminase